LRTPLQQPVNAAEGTVVVNYLLPSVDAAELGSRPLHAVRDYHMAVERVDAVHGDEHYALFWDDSAAAVLLAPIRARAALTSLKMHGATGGSGSEATASGGQLVRVQRRPPTADEDAILQRSYAGVNVSAPPAAAPRGIGQPAPARKTLTTLYERRRAAAVPEDFEPHPGDDEAELSD
jgi:hypothetical protein